MKWKGTGIEIDFVNKLKRDQTALAHTQQTNKQWASCYVNVCVCVCVYMFEQGSMNDKDVEFPFLIIFQYCVWRGGSKKKTFFIIVWTFYSYCISKRKKKLGRKFSFFRTHKTFLEKNKNSTLRFDVEAGLQKKCNLRVKKNI